MLLAMTSARILADRPFLWAAAEWRSDRSAAAVDAAVWQRLSNRMTGARGSSSPWINTDTGHRQLPHWDVCRCCWAAAMASTAADRVRAICWWPALDEPLPLWWSCNGTTNAMVRRT